MFASLTVLFAVMVGTVAQAGAQAEIGRQIAQGAEVRLTRFSD